MFQVGDRVRNAAANVVGVVIDIDGDTVYLEQANGCEVDFAASALVLESAFQAKHDRSVRDDAASRENDAVYDAVMRKLYPAIVGMGQLAHARAGRVPGVAAKDWESLSALQKLNAVSVATQIPVKAWVDAGRPAAKPSLAALQLSILGAKGKK